MIPILTFKFPYYYKENDNTVSSHTCRAGHKYWKTQLLFKTFFKSVEYANDLGETLCFIICKTFTKPHSEAVRQFNLLCAQIE